MDRAIFTNEAPGRLVVFARSPTRYAFVPADLPPDWEFPARLWPLLASAKEALGTLNGIGQTLQDPHLLLRPLQRREAIASSSIEGTYVTPEQLLLHELSPREGSPNDERSADSAEVWNYARALERGGELLATLPICKRVIREMHAILMEGVRGRDKSPGQFRKWQVQIGASARFVPPPASEVERLMDSLEQYSNADDDRYDPLVRSFLVHYQFETIHPFGDGNGRVGRALLALMIQRWMAHPMPWLYMSAFFERYKDEYVNGLLHISSRGAWESWIEFCLTGVVEQANDSIDRCHRFNKLRAEFHRRMRSPSPRSHVIIDDLFRSPIVTVTSLAARLGITYPTAKADIERLLATGILREIAGQSPRTFQAHEIMLIAYGDPREA